MVNEAALAGSYRRLQHRVIGGGPLTPYAAARYHFHALRHVAASLFIEAGLPPKRVQTIMGHTSITMTFELYGHLFEDRNLIDAAMARVGNSLSLRDHA